MSYYWFNGEDLLEKAHKKYHKEDGKEKVTGYYQKNKESIKERERHKYKMLNKEDKDKIKKQVL